MKKYTIFICISLLLILMGSMTSIEALCGDNSILLARRSNVDHSIGQPSPISPPSGSSLREHKVLFQWTPVRGADCYSISVADQTTQQGVSDIYDIVQTSVRIHIPQNGHSYQWNVRAWRNGQRGPISQEWTFTNRR